MNIALNNFARLPKNEMNLVEKFGTKIDDKICSQILSSWSVDVDGIFPNRNF
jgi:hypothetical protein